MSKVRIEFNSHEKEFIVDDILNHPEFTSSTVSSSHPRSNSACTIPILLPSAACISGVASAIVDWKYRCERKGRELELEIDDALLYSTV